MYKGLACIVLLGFSVVVNAGGWTGFKDVSLVGVRGDSASGFYFKLSEMANPDNCGLIDHYFVRSTNPMMKEMYSLLLAAKKSGTQISAQLDGCDNGRPKVISVIDQ
jgi:hypothetical protein